MKAVRSVAGQPRKSSCALWLIRDFVCPRSGALLSCRCDRRAGLTEAHHSGENIYDGGRGQRSSWVSCCVNNPSPPVNIFCLWGHLGLRRRQDRWQQSSSAKSLLCSLRGSWWVISFLSTKPLHVSLVRLFFNWKCHNVELALKIVVPELYFNVLPQIKNDNTLII